MEITIKDEKVFVNVLGTFLNDVGYISVDPSAEMDVFKVSLEMVAVDLIKSNKYSDAMIGIYTLEHIEDLTYRFKYAQEKYYQ